LEERYRAMPDTEDIIDISSPKTYVVGGRVGIKKTSFYEVHKVVCHHSRWRASHRETIWKFVSTLLEGTYVFFKGCSD